MRKYNSNHKLGYLIVLGVFLMFVLSVFGLIFELPRFYRTEMSLDYQKVNPSKVEYSKIEPVEKAELATPVSYRAVPAVYYGNTGYGGSTEQGSWNHIAVAGKRLAVTEVSSLEINPGNATKKFRKMIYGHNTAGVFGVLSSLGIGSTFSVTLGGVTTNYRVSEIVMFEKISSTRLSANGVNYSMDALNRNAKGHSIMLLTCAGQSLGGGDATHRLAVFAD